MQNANTENRVEENGTTTTVHIGGEKYALNDRQLDEVGRRLQAGHNRVGNVAAEQLRSIVERVENLEEEKASISSDIRGIIAEAKGNGFCPKTLRKILALRKKDASQRDEEEHLLDTYLAALNM